MDEQVWLNNKKWASNRIKSSANLTLIVLWCFAAIWNAITLPLWFQLTDILAKAQQDPLAYIAFLFPLVGLYLIVFAINASKEKLQFGDTPLTMDPFPGSLGGHVGGRIETNIPYTGQTDSQITLQCVHSYVSGSGKDRSRRESIEWQNTGVCHLDNSAKGTVFKFRFNLPDDLPESDTGKKSGSYYFWRVSLASSQGSQPLNRNFVIPVFSTQTLSRSIHQGTESNHATLDAAEAGIESVADIRPLEEGGIEIWYPPFQRPGIGISMTLMGLFFIGAGVVMGINNAPLFMAVIFALVGGLIELMGLHYLSKSLLVSATADGIQAKRFFFGYPARTWELDIENFEGFEIKQSGTMQSGSSTKVFYNLQARSRDGTTFTVAERHTSRPEIELIKDKLETAIA